MQNWSIKSFYKQAWKLATTHKKLWILGIAITVATGGQGNFNSNNFPTPPSEDEKPKQVEAQVVATPGTALNKEAGGYEYNFADYLDEEIETSTNADTSDAEIWEQFAEMMVGVPASVYSLIGLELFVMFAFLAVIGIMFNAWAQASLIQGVAVAADDKKVDLTKISHYGMTRIKPLVWLIIVPGLKFFLMVLGVGIVGLIVLGILSVILKDAAAIVWAVGAFLGFGALTFQAIKLSVSLILAKRFIVLENQPGKESFAQAFALAKGNLWKSMRLGAANGFVGGLVSFLLVLPVIGTAVYAFLLYGGDSTVHAPVSAGQNTLLVGLFVIFVLLAVIGITIFSAFWQVFTHATWHFGFKVLTTPEKGGK